MTIATYIWRGFKLLVTAFIVVFGVVPITLSLGVVGLLGGLLATALLVACLNSWILWAFR